MRRGGFLNRPGSRGRVSPWLGVGETPLMGGEAPETLQNSSICKITLWPLMASCNFLVLLFVKDSVVNAHVFYMKKKEKRILLLNSGGGVGGSGPPGTTRPPPPDSALCVVCVCPCVCVYLCARMCVSTRIRACRLHNMYKNSIHLAN